MPLQRNQENKSFFEYIVPEQGIYYAKENDEYREIKIENDSNIYSSAPMEILTVGEYKQALLNLPKRITMSEIAGLKDFYPGFLFEAVVEGPSPEVCQLLRILTARVKKKGKKLTLHVLQTEDGLIDPKEISIIHSISITIFGNKGEPIYRTTYAVAGSLDFDYHLGVSGNQSAPAVPLYFRYKFTIQNEIKG